MRTSTPVSLLAAAVSLASCAVTLAQQDRLRALNDTAALQSVSDWIRAARHSRFKIP
jgi:hypothetical protein